MTGNISLPRLSKISIGLTLLLCLAVVLFTPSATVLADHTANPTSVTIAGSLQDELGCPGDWQPECDSTKLAYAGDDDVWQATFSIPAGNWEYKAALNNSWDENYGANAVPNGSNIGLALPDPTDVKFYYDHKSHWVTDNANAVIATVPGSFQSALGCPDDWQPDCLRSWLQDPDGDGLYKFNTTAIPAGSYEAKVAHNESWAENYGAGGQANGPNIPFTVGPGDTVIFSYNPGTHLLEITTESPSSPDPEDHDLVRASLQHPFEDEVLYFVIPDRFDDGNANNNCGDYSGTCVEDDTQENVLQHGYLPRDRGYYHGGDLKGLRQQLPYLKRMGVTAIWVGPIFKNKPVQEDSSNLYGHSSGYHGYWILDFENVDPHLGTNQEFKGVINKAHRMGIKVFMDIITNHTADVITYQEHEFDYLNKDDFPYVDVNGNPFDDSDFAYAGQPDYNFPQVDLNSFPYTPAVPGPEQDSKSPDWLDNPLLYHNRGNSSFAGENSLYGDFYGLDDLWTERKEVVEGMIDIYKFWIEEFGVDGFRIDTTKHVNMKFWQVFGPEILAAAKAEGIDHFFAFGEVYDQQFGPSFLSQFSTRGKLQSTIDFAFQMAAREFASQGGPANNLRDFFAGDDYYIDANGNAYIMPTFIGNHDMGRIGYFLTQDNPTATDAELLARAKQVHALMFFARGQPVIYYGDEQGFVGDGGDKLARQDMFPSQVPEYNDDDLIGTDATTAEANFDKWHPLYRALRRYAWLYKWHDTLRRGAQIHRYSTAESGVYAFSRIERHQKVEYIVAFNNDPRQSQPVTVPTFYPAKAWFGLVYRSTDLFDGPGLNLSAMEALDADSLADERSLIPDLDLDLDLPPEPFSSDTIDEIYLPLIFKGPGGATGPDGILSDLAWPSAEFPWLLSTDDDGQLTFNVPASGFIIYKAFHRMPRSDAAPNINITTLDNGQEVTLPVTSQDGHEIVERLEIRAELSADIFAEVTFAVKVGDGEYEPIGTDDNPPYRVFYDATQYRGQAESPPLAFKAIVNDLSGHLNSDEVENVTLTIEEPAPPPTDAGYAIIHYYRADGDYGDHTTGNFNDFWGLHLWGEAIDPAEGTDWTSPKPFLGEDEYGRFAYIELADPSQDLNYIVHRGDTKDGTDQDRSFNPAANGRELWVKQDDGNNYFSQAEAQGYVTVHYRRPGDDYTGWGLHLWGEAIDPAEGTTWDSPKLPTGFDDYGAYFDILVQDVSQPVNFIVHQGDDKDPPNSPDRSFIPAETASIWLKQADVAVYNQRGAAEGFAIIHYHRDAGDYGDYSSTDYNDFWGLHTWGDTNDPGWTTPRKATGQDTFGVFFKVELFENAGLLNYILHRGDEKDPGPDQALDLTEYGYEVWQVQGADPDNPYVHPVSAIEGGPGGDLSKAQAHWVAEDTIAWDITHQTGNSYALHYAPDGGMALSNGELTGGLALALTYDPAGLSTDITAKFPHLADFAAFKVGPADLPAVPAALKSQLAVSAQNGEGTVIDAAGLQIPGVLDDLYTYTGPLGVIYNGAAPTLRVWAPTARAVRLFLFDTAASDPASQIIDMTAGEQGTWSASGDASWTEMYYLYEVEVYVHSTGQVEYNLVTDPYSIGLAQDSRRSLIVDLADSALKPAGWDTLAKPALAAPEEIVLYELHLRDFSINDAAVPAAERGTYKAFTRTGSNGMTHLQNLAQAGLTHLHLLPSFDIATIRENPADRTEPVIPAAPPDSDQQQAAVAAVADLDGYNWGYDPFHYTVPEGSYATDADGATRLLEFRQMVQALNQSGLRVVMDVVYNHTNASGQAEKSVLDKVVPGYYHRLDADGNVTTSTCCQNTATEHAMMEKLMIDSLVTWATAYKVDGFRFDLMGHHMKSNMLKVRDTLNALTVASDGVDGSKIYIYGEGWNFGEVADGARGENATQFNMAGTGLGTFNDRLRDAVRGGGPFDGGQDLIRNQGFINGLFYDPNAQAAPPADQEAELLLSADQIRVGLAGNLADYQFEDRTGAVVSGSQIDYNDSPAGYTQDPQEHIVYVSAHDNQTLFDISQYKHPSTTSMADRVRAQNLGIDLTMLSQGVPFFHAGVDLLRSKSLDRDSYNSGDWFNKLDFTYQSNNWGVGLPIEAVNADDWSLMQPLLADPDLNPGQGDIEAVAAHMQEMLAIRHSSKLFRLETEQEVIDRLSFHNTGPGQVRGLIVMSLADGGALVDLDPNYNLIVVLFNASNQAQTFTVAAWAGAGLQLHPVQQSSGDPVVQSAAFDPGLGEFTVPARTTAVFVQ